MKYEWAVIFILPLLHCKMVIHATFLLQYLHIYTVDGKGHYLTKCILQALVAVAVGWTSSKLHQVHVSDVSPAVAASLSTTPSHEMST